LEERKALIEALSRARRSGANADARGKVLRVVHEEGAPARERVALGAKLEIQRQPEAVPVEDPSAADR
jgi:hypothetical protein